MEKTTYATEQVMMTLCNIAYEENAARFQYLIRSKHYATQNHWKVVWGPATDDLTAFAMFVAENALTKEQAVVIRGSVISAEKPVQTIIDWMDDLEVFNLAPFSDNAGHGKISSGSHKALQYLKQMKDPNSGKTLQQHIDETAPERLIITGHSLGGMLTSVLTGWLRPLYPKIKILAYSFAAPTAGDAQFAEYVGNRDFYRFWNEWDFVPQGFAEQAMLGALKWYPNPGTTMNLAEKLLIDGLVALRPKPNPYTQPGGLGIMLPGKITPSISFAQQLAHQHLGNTYLKLLDAPEVSFLQS